MSFQLEANENLCRKIMKIVISFKKIKEKLLKIKLFFIFELSKGYVTELGTHFKRAHICHIANTRVFANIGSKV